MTLRSALPYSEKMSVNRLYLRMGLPREWGLAQQQAVVPVPIVRRDKAPIFSGCNSHPATFAPAGSNRSGSGGNETAEASDGKDR